MAKPDMCDMEAWKQLANGRKVEMCRLVENSSRYNFSNACMHGLLSVRMHALLWDWLTQGLKCSVGMAINRTSTSQGSQDPLGFALKETSEVKLVATGNA